MRRVMTCVMVAGCVLALAVTPALANVVPYFDVNGSQEAILSEMPLHPAAIHVGGITYFGYQGPGFDSYVISYEPATDTWDGPYRAGTNPLSIDAHGAPSLHMDAAGYLHIYYGCHNTRLRHARTRTPGDISSWVQLSSVAAHATYPQTMYMPDGRFAIFYRSGNLVSDWVVRMSTNDGASFGSVGAILAGDANTGWYMDIRRGDSGRIHLVFLELDYDMIRDGRLFAARQDVFYVVRELDGTWRANDGTPLSLPIDETEARDHCRVFESGTDLVNEISVKEDASGAPCILFLTGSGAGPSSYEWRFMRKVGASWSSSTITVTDHSFDAGALDPQPDGSFEAFVNTQDSDARGALDGDYRGRGGRIVRYTSPTGAVWTRAGRVSPNDGPGVIFSDPQLVRDGDAEARVFFSDWTQQENDFHRRMFLWGDGGLVTRDIDPGVTRLQGSDRIRTCVDISQRAFPEGARWVVLATAYDYPDALAGGPLAHSLWAPLLLTHGGGLSDAVAAEIRRLGATNAIVLGGTRAISDTVISDLRRETDVTNVERVYGSNRYRTAVAIADRMYDRTHDIDTAVVVDGRNWADAVVAAPLAGARGYPIILVEGNWLRRETDDIIDRWGITDTIIVGGPAAVTDRQEDNLPSPTRLWGSDRYGTAAAVADYGLTHGLLPGRVLVASGASFPDALSGSMLGARVRGPVLLTPQDELPRAAERYLQDHGDEVVDIFVLGEPDVVSTSVGARVLQLVEGP